MFKQSFALAIAAAAALAAPGASAAPQGLSVAVDYSDLNLTTEKGQKTLERRLENAARDVCGIEMEKTGSRLVDPKARSCYTTAIRELNVQFAELLSNSRRGG